MTHYRGSEVVQTQCFDCDRADRLKTWDTDRVLTTSLMLDAAIALYHPDKYPEDAWGDIELAIEEVKDQIPQFDQQVWWAGLRKQMMESEYRGSSRLDGDFKFLAYTIAGRYLFTLEDAEASVTFITIDSADAKMGIQGIRATKQKALGLVERGIKLWQQHGSLEVDHEVGMI